MGTPQTEADVAELAEDEQGQAASQEDLHIVLKPNSQTGAC